MLTRAAWASSHKVECKWLAVNPNWCTRIHTHTHSLNYVCIWYSRVQVEPAPVGLNVNDSLLTQTLLGSEPCVNDATATWLAQFPPSDPRLMLPEKVRVWNILARSLRVCVYVLCMYACICMHVCLFQCVYTCVCVCCNYCYHIHGWHAPVYIYIYIYIYIYMYVHIYTRMWYTYTYTHEKKHLTWPPIKDVRTYVYVCITQHLTWNRFHST